MAGVGVVSALTKAKNLKIGSTSTESIKSGIIFGIYHEQRLFINVCKPLTLEAAELPIHVRSFKENMLIMSAYKLLRADKGNDYIGHIYKHDGIIKQEIIRCHELDKDILPELRVFCSNSPTTFDNIHSYENKCLIIKSKINWSNETSVKNGSKLIRELSREILEKLEL